MAIHSCQILCINCKVTNFTLQSQNGPFIDTKCAASDSPSIILFYSQFTNITSAPTYPMLQIHHQSTEYSSILKISNTVFKEIFIQQDGVNVNSLIRDDTGLSNFRVANTTFDMNYGAVYISQHNTRNELYFDSISIVNHAGYSDIDWQFFEFAVSDVAHINGLDIFHHYNLANAYCHKANHPLVNDAITPSTCILYSLCWNTWRLIWNKGHVIMDQINIRVNISGENHTNCHQYWYSDSQHHTSYIENEGHIQISNMMVQMTLCYYFISNQGTPNISNMTILRTANFNPNDLQSNYIIYQYSSSSPITIIQNNSRFVGSRTQININAGAVEVYNSAFQDSLQPISSNSATKVVISNSFMEYLLLYRVNPKTA